MLAPIKCSLAMGGELRAARLIGDLFYGCFLHVPFIFGTRFARACI